MNGRFARRSAIEELLVCRKMQISPTLCSAGKFNAEQFSSPTLWKRLKNKHLNAAQNALCSNRGGQQGTATNRNTGERATSFVKMVRVLLRSPARSTAAAPTAVAVPEPVPEAEEEDYNEAATDQMRNSRELRRTSLDISGHRFAKNLKVRVFHCRPAQSKTTHQLTICVHVRLNMCDDFFFGPPTAVSIVCSRHVRR